MDTRSACDQRPDVLDLVCEIQREFSRQTEPGGLVRVFVEELARLLPVSRMLYVMPWPPPVRRFASAPGQEATPGSLGYRVLLDLEASRIAQQDPGVFRGMFVPRPDDEPDGRGGLLAEITGQSQPLLRGELTLCDDPLGPAASNHRSVIAVPVFWQGLVQGWIVVFADKPDAFTRDDLRLLLTTGNSLVRSTVYLDGLEETRRANERVRATLAQIGSAQRSMLPAEHARDAGARLAIAYETCDESGGDHYDIHEPSPGQLEVVLADVSGHGALATMGVAMLRTAILAQRRAGLTGVDAVREIDALMRDSLQPGMFVTAAFVSLNLDSGMAEIINCGHPPPLIRRANGTVESVPVGGGLPLGISDVTDADPTSCSVAPGDLLVLYSDGLTESFSPGGEQFGLGRLTDAVERGRGDPDHTRALILEDIVRHEGARPRRDDQTLILVSRVNT